MLRIGRSSRQRYAHRLFIALGTGAFGSKTFAHGALILFALVPATLAQRVTRPAAAAQANSRLTMTQFIKLMERVSRGWNEGNAKMAADCFSKDAQYSAPPSSPRSGRQSLFEYFGGAQGRELPMHMQWHHLVFDSRRQIGMGEYTFKYRIQTHGVVVVKMENGFIKNWREYEIESELPWEQFVGTNRF